MVLLFQISNGERCWDTGGGHQQHARHSHNMTTYVVIELGTEVTCVVTIVVGVPGYLSVLLQV
jgi:hypothetical protein